MKKLLIASIFASASFLAIACSDSTSSELPNNCMDKCLESGNSENLCNIGCKDKD